MTTINIDGLAMLVVEYDALVAEAKRIAEAAEALKAHIQHEMGEHDTATIAGKPAFTYSPTGMFNSKRFETELPGVAERYMVLREVIDQDKLRAEQPDLFTHYRARRFLRKG